MAEESISKPQDKLVEMIQSEEQRENKWKKNFFKQNLGTFVVVQPLRISLPVQGTQVWSLLQEDSSCWGATKLNCGSRRAHALQQEKSPQREACAAQLDCSTRLLQPKRAHAQQRRPSAAKNKINKNGIWGFPAGIVYRIWQFCCDLGLIPGWGTEIPQTAAWPERKTNAGLERPVGQYQMV